MAKYHDLVQSGECLVPGLTPCDPQDEAGHIARYEWALQFARGWTVLDVACGCGYGTKILAETATHVHGIDLNSDAIQYAWDHYAVPNNGFEERSVYAISRLERFGVIVSFETIEHLRNPERFIAQCWKALIEGGTLVMSAPEGSSSSWHFWDFTQQELYEVIATRFDMSGARYFCQGFGALIKEPAEGDKNTLALPRTHIFVVRKE